VKFKEPTKAAANKRRTHMGLTASMGLTVSLDDVVGEEQHFDVVVVGSGAAGASFLDRIASSGARVLILESGEMVLGSHFNNLLDNSLRAEFIRQHKTQPWTGDLREGMLLPMLGGRGVAAGAHLLPFYSQDFRLWDRGTWPDEVIQRLPQLYRDAEYDRRVNTSAISGEAQTHFGSILTDFAPHLPTVGVDLAHPEGFKTSRGYDSSVGRMIPHLLAERVRHPSLKDCCILAATGAHVVRLLSSGSRVTGLECLDPKRPNDPLRRIRATAYVLGASAVESARLVLNSNMAADRPATGRYLAEHIERRAKIRVRFDGGGEAISLVIPPPPSSDSLDRYQIHLRGSRVERTRDFIVDVGGFAAMDPEPRNRVTPSAELDRFGLPRAHTYLLPSENDNARAWRLSERIVEIANRIGGEFITERFPPEGVESRYTDEHRRVQVMPPGRSYHECGTMRMGEKSTNDTVTDTSGRLNGLENLYVIDAGLFPCVGVANPMFTISALAYLVADEVRQYLGCRSVAVAI
jgi:choline dehydrogenase-like flavoprotein